MKETELITNIDNTVFHLHLKGDEIADRVIIVGDPARVDLVASMFDIIKIRKSNREFHTITGISSGKEITVISSGIGTDNIDILINELDAAVNYDLAGKKRLKEKRTLSFVRMGTSGGLQGDIEPGTFVVSSRAIGFDNVLNFYTGIDEITDTSFESALMKHLEWSPRLSRPYIVDADSDLLSLFTNEGIRAGLTISAPGFYAPQGRTLSIEPVMAGINDRIETFRYGDEIILNYEMESSAIYGLSALLGHKAVTVCSVIGNRVSGKFLNDYRRSILELTRLVLKLI
ncbi:MAG: nucleoside phosphorylase [Marinilabiliaceae bacterium]|jgi:uridine phosphorylase|nr:nucleoside phosphorylase [Marinilabiliaceae bacterium]